MESKGGRGDLVRKRLVKVVDARHPRLRVTR